MKYLAVFDLAGGRYHSALMRCQAAAAESHRLAAFLSQAMDEVNAARVVHPAVRLTVGNGNVELLLWLGGTEMAAVEKLVDAVQAQARRLSVECHRARSSSEFDGWTRVLHVTEEVQVSNYQAGGLGIVPQFSLAEACAQVLASHRGGVIVYQANILHRCITGDDERVVRKWLLQLGENRAIPLPVLRSQEQRVVQRGEWRALVNEWLMASRPEDLDACHRAADETFLSDNRLMGELGSPLRRATECDSVAAGIHPSLLGASVTAVSLAASLPLGKSRECLLMPFGSEPRSNGGRRPVDRASGDPMVFVSYAFRDFAVASKICGALEDERITCWMAPRDIPPGDSYGECIVRGIERAKVLVLVFSDRSNASKYVLREVERAVAHNLIVIPFRIETGNASGAMQFFLATCQWIDGVAGESFDQGIRRLVERVRGVV